MAAADYACSYCLEGLNAMIDPRELPCGHVFCLGCLRQDFGAGGDNTRCSQCGELHNGLDIDELPEVSLTAELQEQVSTKKGTVHYLPVTCSRQCTKNAICFCGNCSSRFCETHKQAHDAFIISHKYVPFDEYRRVPEKYDKPLCGVHKTGLTLACEVCDLLVCDECDLTTDCGRHGVTHKLKSLTKSETKFAKEYKKHIVEISEMHSTFSKTRKETWNRFDNLVAMYDEGDKLKAVDREGERQIAEIRRRVEMRKQQIKHFPTHMDTVVTAYIEELEGKEQQLGDLQKSLSLLMRESHITELIRQNKDNQKDISAAKQLKVGSCGILREMVVVPTGCLRDVEVQLRPLMPEKLTKFATGPYTVQFVTLTDCGDLLFYSGGMVMITDLHCKLTKASRPATGVVSLAQNRDRVFIASFEENHLLCTSYNYRLANSKKICNFRCEYPGSQPVMSITEDFFIVIENSSYSSSLQIYDHMGTKIRSITLPEKATGVWSLPEGKVLLMVKNCMVSFDIRPDVPVLQWKDSAGYCCMSADSSGLCFGTSHLYRKMQQIELHRCDSGEKVKILPTEEYQNIVEMNVRNNMLAIRDGNNKLYLYHIEYYQSP